MVEAGRTLLRLCELGRSCVPLIRGQVEEEEEEEKEEAHEEQNSPTGGVARIMVRKPVEREAGVVCRTVWQFPAPSTRVRGGNRRRDSGRSRGRRSSHAI